MQLNDLLTAWTVARPGQAGYAVQMWRHSLDYYSRPPAERCDASGALPYLPVEPQAFGCSLNPDDQVLDAGCLGGHGLFDFAMRRRDAGLPVPQLTGVDIDAEAIALADHTAAAWSDSVAVNFQVASVEALPFDDGRFRLIIARLVLPYVRIMPALDELRRVLADEGMLVIQVHGPGYYWRQLRRHWRHPATAAYYLRPLMTGFWLRLSGRQLCHPWWRETALSETQLVHLMRRRGMTPVWSAHDRVRPMIGAVEEKAEKLKAES